MDPSSSSSTSYNVADAYSESWLYCPLGGPTPAERLAHRMKALEALGLLEVESVPVFEEAAQMAAHFLRMPICTLSIANETTEIFKAANGLSHLGLMNPLAKTRQLSLTESFGVNVLDSEQTCVLSDLAQHPAFVNYQLVCNYGIYAYAGVPLITSQGCCIGMLAVMDRQPHRFTSQEIAFLELTARWSMSEYERTYQPTHIPHPAIIAQAETASSTQGRDSLRMLIDSVRLSLINQLTQELRNPLTSVMGMASMLSREIYGPLTDKQREYTDIVCSSSQTLMTLVDEIVELGALDESYQQVTPTSVDIEMLCQQVLKTLEPTAEKREQRLMLTIEPGMRVWVLDKGKVKQLLYHLMFSVIQKAGESSVIRLHASRRDDRLNMAIWLSNPWLGEGLPQTLVNLGESFLSPFHTYAAGAEAFSYLTAGREDEFFMDRPADMASPQGQYSRELLGLLLSRHLAELHGGTIGIQGSQEAGYRFVVSIPSLVNAAKMLEYSPSVQAFD